MRGGKDSQISRATCANLCTLHRSLNQSDAAMCAVRSCLHVLGITGSCRPLQPALSCNACNLHALRRHATKYMHVPYTNACGSAYLRRLPSLALSHTLERPCHVVCATCTPASSENSLDSTRHDHDLDVLPDAETDMSPRPLQYEYYRWLDTAFYIVRWCSRCPQTANAWTPS